MGSEAHCSPPVAEAEQNQLALFALLFRKERFTRFDELQRQIAIDLATFEKQARPLNTPAALTQFILGSREVLEHLRLAAQARIDEARVGRLRLTAEEQSLRNEWEVEGATLLNSLMFDTLRVPTQAFLDRLAARLGLLERSELQAIRDHLRQAGASMTNVLTGTINTWVERAFRINSATRALRLQRTTFTVADAFQVWGERQTDPDDITPRTFAEQVAYVFFVRLLLVRVLEDKQVITRRLASDGGFADWSDYVRRNFEEVAGVSILNENYYQLLARKAGQYYLHFFQQSVFDWYVPDDYLLVETLDFLCRYNFRDVSSDIIGFTFAEYIDRTARGRKGHYLTPPDVVDYMLDLLEYRGPEVLGRSVIDPASGSGSFLVHAARRYRDALVEALCGTYGLPDATALAAHTEARRELARTYLAALTTQFVGMERNPFGCYLAEMNLLIQALDDLVILRGTPDGGPINRFAIYNTDSLDLPPEVLAITSPTTTASLIPDRYSERLIDEAYPIKARLGSYAGGFFYVIANPPYVNRRQESFDTDRYRSAPFYGSVLAGDVNLYLLFLRLGIHYLSDYGRMIFIIPLPIFGDRSASAAREMVATTPFSVTAAIRFYRGNVLFRGVDQAVGVLRVDRIDPPATTLVVSGGESLRDARAAQFATPTANVIGVTPRTNLWQQNWLVTTSQASVDIWQHAMNISRNGLQMLADLVDATFDMQQGDVNATVINPLRRGRAGRQAPTDIAIYKGDDALPWAPFPATPSDWATTVPAAGVLPQAQRAAQVLATINQRPTREVGMVLRQVARLNTRERLTATWFERDAAHPLAFTNEVWRMAVLPGANADDGKALLALCMSRTIAYLINLFSTNNHVGKDELRRVPIPAAGTFPRQRLAQLATDLLTARETVETAYVQPYGVQLPEYFEAGDVYLPPSAILTQNPTLVPTVTLAVLEQRQVVQNTGQATRTLDVLLQRGHITWPNVSSEMAASLDLWFRDPAHQRLTWAQARAWVFPEPMAAGRWLTTYRMVAGQAQAVWDRVIQLQQDIDDEVMAWYGYTAFLPLVDELRQGVAWARRGRSTHPSPSPVPLGTPATTAPGSSIQTARVAVVSSNLAAVGYNSTAEVLEIEFQDGRIVQYAPVPADVHAALMAAASKGQFYQEQVRGKFPRREEMSEPNGQLPEDGAEPPAPAS